MSNELKSVGLLLGGHGTRDEGGVQQFLELAEGLKRRFKPLPVEAAFLELAHPNIQTGVERLLERGVGEIVTVPVILFAAGHVKRDIPGQVVAALVARGRSDVRQVQVEHLGCHPAVVELSRVRMEEAKRGGASGCGVPMRDSGKESGRLAACPTEVVGTAHPTCLLLVARGSSDEGAAAEMREFAALRRAARPEMPVEVAFLAKTRPNLDEQLAKLTAASFERVIVQPHFLFEGELVDRIRGQIMEIAARQPQTQWIVTQPLADSAGKAGLASELLAKVILDRCGEAGIRVVASPDDD
ncbi:MAG TPA: sirohydrochlorin chelatase [Pirellulaceae bacterium]|jgi:sirohydrochlorin cobaltochelatase